MGSERDGDGMTDMQLKAYLLDQLENWQRIVDLASATNAKEIKTEAKKQIKKINMTLRF